ncbi:MAG: tetraacyldisaccharide 4'-kinase [Chloroherpetonaceae bacterium]|nr:tetraacyldisaccharide 4'-kinase [Chloroherpetonaceae bacterium]
MKLALKALALFYEFITTLRNKAFEKGFLKVYNSPIPVVSVGNLSVGGEGKTPIVDWLIQFYLSQNVRVAVISRGYGRKTKGTLTVCDGNLVRLSASEAGDEPLMLARRNPKTIVVVAEVRSEGVELILRDFGNHLPDVILLDDGFQHQSIRRDLDLLVINPLRSPFEDFLIPLGRLRESVDGIKRADFILLSKVDRYSPIKQITKEIAPYHKPIVKTTMVIKGLRSFATGELIDLGKNNFNYTSVFAFCGIGDPNSFRETLEYAGLLVDEFKVFPDHYIFQERDIEDILLRRLRKGINLIVTTEKDYFRLKANEQIFGRLAKDACFYLEIGVEFGVDSKNENDLLASKLISVLNMHAN